MARHARRDADIGLSAITVEGGLISPEQLAGIAATTPDQKAADDYGCPRGVSLRDEITRYYRIGQAHWRDFARIETPTAVQTAAFARKLLADCFAFDDLKGPIVHQVEGHTYRLALEAREGRVPIVAAAPPADPKVDAFNRALPEMGDDPGGSIARRSPATLLQAWLNANPDRLWGLVFAGDRVRLMRDNASFTRAAHIEADLGAIFRDEMFADFTTLWLLIHATRFGAAGAGPADSALERWREAGQKSGTAVRERLRQNVEQALLLLGQGLIDENPELARRMADEPATLTAVYEEMLRVVYRLIFLGVGEARGLLHPKTATQGAIALYADSYGFSHMRERAARRAAHDHHHDAWEAARIVFRSLERGEKTLGLPALGGLFAGGKTPNLDAARLSNRAWLGAVACLSWLIEDGRRTRINWRDMATEELGSVYEGLLELVPQITEQGEVFDFAGGAEARGNARKISGSYYTPDSLVQALLDTALNPLLEQAEAEGGAEAILKLRIIDPACGSGHFLLGAARRMATRVAQLRDPDAPDYQAAMRDVVRLCVHGVDRNPMAVELAKVALWIEAVEPGKPLAFLDANIRCGDSLFGVFDLKVLTEGIPDAAYKPLTGDDKEAAKVAGKVNRQQRANRTQGDLLGGAAAQDLARAAERLHAMPEDTLAEMNAKADAFERLRAGAGWGARKLACDLYVAAFLRKKAFRADFAQSKKVDRVPTTLDVRAALSGQQGDPALTALAVDLAENARAFHWPLEFPDIFARGGFDLVVGNPPWERIKLQEKEFFSARHAEVASARHSAARKAIIERLAASPPGTADHQIFAEFERESRNADAASAFARIDSESFGRFPLAGRGDINTYALFAELISQLMRESGNAGFLAPLGLSTDQTTSVLFSSLIERGYINRIIGFENEEFIFPDVHNATKFCIYSFSRAFNTGTKFQFLLRNVDQRHNADRMFSLTAGELRAINPNTRTAPIFRSNADAEIARAIHQRFPILFGDEVGENPWKMRFLAMFHMANDSGLFVDVASNHRKFDHLIESDGLSRGDLVALYEGKMFHQLNHRHGTYELHTFREGKLVKEVPPPSDDQLRSPGYDVTARYWVPASEVKRRVSDTGWSHDWLIGYRKITGATLYRTMISSVLPLVGVGDSTPLVFIGLSPQYSAIIAGLFSSLPFDYIARLKLGGTNFTYNYLRQIPAPPPEAYAKADLDFIVPRVLELTYTSHSMAPFARDLGYESEPFKWDEDRRALLRAELDAWYARAYGLTRDELRYILDPADVMGPDYPSETFRVLKDKEIRKYGEYRTQRLVLAAWDEQEAR